MSFKGALLCATIIGLSHADWHTGDFYRLGHELPKHKPRRKKGKKKDAKQNRRKRRTA